MSTWAVLLAGVLYLITAVDLALQGKHGLALAFFAYFVANIGLVIAARE